MLVQIYCKVDDFCKEIERATPETKLLWSGKRCLQKDFTMMSLSEMAAILIYFHSSGYHTFKDYYTRSDELKRWFPGKSSYNRFVEREAETFILLTLLMKAIGMGVCRGIGFVDSMPLPTCHNRRIYSHRVFKGIVQRGKTSMGWFYGFKLHLIINESGEILSFVLTPGNVDDRNWSVMQRLTQKIIGKLFGDRGYISAELFEKLYQKGIQLFTRTKKNMKKMLMGVYDKFLLNKRGVIESVNNKLKNSCKINHTRHRSPKNFLVNLVAGLLAYSFDDKKPSIKTEFLAMLQSFA